MPKASKKKSEQQPAASASAWPNMPAIDLENDPYFKRVRESTKDALQCPHCDQLYFLCDAKNEETGVVVCPECDCEIESSES